MPQPSGNGGQQGNSSKGNWLVVLVAILGVLAVFLPVLVVIFDIASAVPTDAAGWGKQLATLAGTIVALLLYFTSMKNERNHLSGLKIGRQITIKDWELSTRSLVGAQRHINQAIAQNPAKRPDEAKQAIRNVMDYVGEIVAGVFENVVGHELTVTLGIPLDDGLQMKIVELKPQTSERLAGGKYPFPARKEDLRSMLEAYKTGKVVYTPDATQSKGMEGKKYHSILSFPVIDHRRCPIAVVNVDSIHIALFDKEGEAVPDDASITLIYELIQPALQLVVGALEHCQPYPTGANS